MNDTHCKISAATLARTAALALALTNQVLSACGKPTLPIESATVEQLVTTGLTVTVVGVVNDANPTSSDAILAQSQTLVLLAQQLNTGNGDALRTIACMAQAVARGCELSDLTEEETGIMAHFKNPAMPSVAVTADAAIKIASARKEFAGTDTFLEMIGFDQADIRRIKAQEQRQRGQKLLMEMEDADLSENVE